MPSSALAAIDKSEFQPQTWMSLLASLVVWVPIADMQTCRHWISFHSSARKSPQPSWRITTKSWNSKCGTEQVDEPLAPLLVVVAQPHQTMDSHYGHVDPR
ncbi:hypothetical protein E4U52_000608 [Claviceps spartinae]|nr:hypothetical protein E4U52_000608 [Claviceps spartinae]